MAIPIVFVRYAPGACGTFLLTLLQTSSQVACWNPELEFIKNTSNFEDEFYKWFITKFTNDLSGHIVHEPHHPYKLHFFSSRYPRGDDITEEGFIQLLSQNQDRLFLDNIALNKYTAMRLNKPVIPVFAKNSPSINIQIDSESEKWFHRTRWVKLFGIENNFFISKQEHPDYVKVRNDMSKLKFRNQYQFDESWYSFIKKNIINDPTVKTFKNYDSIIADPSNHNSPNYFINLSNILDKTIAVDHIHQIFNYLNFDFNRSLVEKCYNHYYETNILPIINYKSLG